MLIRFAMVFLLASCAFAQEVWNDWSDAKTVKEKLHLAQTNGFVFYSQYDYYPARKHGILRSKYVDALNKHLLIYGLDLYYASGTYFPKDEIAKNRSNLIQIVKKAWNDHRAIPNFSWHLENPYVPSSFNKKMGCRFNYKSPDYPQNHKFIIKEILQDSGDSCGLGNWSRIDNENGFKNPRAWFIERVNEISQIFNELVDDNGNRIPFIFRPWHESNGDWMWWGIHSVSKDDFKNFFIFTRNLVENFAPQAQILWAYSPDRYFDDEKKYMFHYPGDEYIDLIGFDDYSIGKPTKKLDESIKRAKVVTKIAKEHKKIACLFETDNKHEQTSDVFFKDYIKKMLDNNEVHLAIVQLWSVGRFNTENEKNDRREFLHQRNVIVVK